MENWRDVVDEIYARKNVRDSAGVEYAVHSEIPMLYADALYRTVLEIKPEVTIEVGMAFGLSSLAVGGALLELGKGGRLISIDPNQDDQWHGVGRANLKRIGFERHELMVDKSFNALPELLRRGTAANFAYIDGWHTFDYVLNDFFYIDKMLSVGGVVGFNDVSWRSVHKVLGFLRGHRRYAEMNVGLPAEYGQGIGALIRWFERRSAADRYFKKLEAWEPRWDYYAAF